MGMILTEIPTTVLPIVAEGTPRPTQTRYGSAVHLAFVDQPTLCQRTPAGPGDTSEEPYCVMCLTIWLSIVAEYHAVCDNDEDREADAFDYF